MIFKKKIILPKHFHTITNLMDNFLHFFFKLRPHLSHEKHGIFEDDNIFQC